MYKLFTIPLAARYDVNFGEFYETKSAETVSRLVQREIERSDLEHERAKEKGRKNRHFGFCLESHELCLFQSSHEG